MHRRSPSLATGLLLGFIAAGFIAAPVLATPVVAMTPAARIAGEWNPGYSAEEVGGAITVDGYGVGGIGVYPLRLDDGTIVSAVCVQADVGHSLDVEYGQDPGPAVDSAELAYLLWRYLRPGLAAPSDDIAAAINVLAWRYSDAQRSSGGSVWQGDDVDVVASGVGHLRDVEQTIDTLRAEAAARLGPWTLSEQQSARADGGG
ncbi:MAG: hypothetical protein M3487_07730, partial [Actinomycetota bacterium]|nr:hypothetical protein [Actinomycetota bacterium]